MCLASKTFWVAGSGQHTLLAADMLLPGQSGVVHPSYVGSGSSLGTGFQSGRMVTIDCRTCWPCIQKYQNAVVGSLLAETAFAEKAVSLTLTYANDAGSDTRSDLAHKMLMGNHIREFTERMRRRRDFGRARYLVAGEYGPLHGRAHWHAIVIFTDGVPEFDFSAERYNDNRLWPFGFIQAKPCETEKGFAYAAKYAVKAQQIMKGHDGYMPGVETVLRRSRIPPLGLPFFLERATEQADFGVPLSMNYLPPGGVEKARYHVRGLASRLRMAHAYLDRLAEQGFDVSSYGVLPVGAPPASGPRIPVSPDADISRLLQRALRERHLLAQPVADDFQEFADALAERQLVQERINAAELKRRRKAAMARQDRISREYELSFRDDPDDPFWHDYDAARHAESVLRRGSWKYD